MPKLTRVALLAVLFTAGGCQTYTQKPVDLTNYDTQWSELLSQTDPFTSSARRLNGPDADGPTADDGLTLFEARIVALVGNPELRRARLEAGVPRASAEYAGRWADPVLELGVMRNVDTGTDPWIVGGSLGFTIPLSGGLRVERELAETQATQAQLQALTAEWQLLRELDRAWLAWSAQRQKAGALRGYLEELSSLIGTAEQLVEAGEIAPTEARLLRIDQARRRLELATLEAAAGQHEMELLALMGLRPDAGVELLPSDLAIEQAEPSAAADPADALASIEASYPPLRAKLAGYDSAELALQREVRKQYPDLTIGPAVEEDEGQSKIGLGLSIPLPLINRNQRGIAEARARRELAQAEVEQVYQQAVAEIASARQRLDAASARRAGIVEQLSPLVEAQVREVRGLIELGEVEVLLLKDALEAVVEARLAVIDAEADEAAAAAALRALTEPGIDWDQSGVHEMEAK